MNEGWIKLYRKSFNHWLYKENRPHTKREAWEDILLLSNHSDEKVLIGNQLIECKRGQSIVSLNSWAKTFNWTISKVRRFFVLLEKDSMIELENVQKSTRITICNYELYQGDRNDNETILKSKRNDNETQTATNKNVKNVKNILKPENFQLFSEVVSLFDSKYYKEEKWLDCYDKLIRVDNFTENEILKIVKEYRSDGNWWKDKANFETLPKLREKNKDGVKYIDVFKIRLQNNSNINGNKSTEPTGFSDKNRYHIPAI